MLTKDSKNINSMLTQNKGLVISFRNNVGQIEFHTFP